MALDPKARAQVFRNNPSDDVDYASSLDRKVRHDDADGNFVDAPDAQVGYVVEGLAGVEPSM